MDHGALAALADEALGWRAKSFPDSKQLPTLQALRDTRPSLFENGFKTPIATLRSSALQHNIDQMAAFCKTENVDLAPHGKTTMAPQLFERQIAAGAWGITVATPWQAEVCRVFGVERILLANQLTDPVAIGWLAAELERDENFELLMYVDHPKGVELVTEVLGSSRLRRPFDVLVETGSVGGRTGCRDDASVNEVVEAVRRSPFHRLVGVSSYEGLIGDDDSPEVMAELRRFLGRQRDTAERLALAGEFASDRAVVLTAGGSQFFDVVVEELSGSLAGELPVQVILRSGGYAIHDETLYEEVSPFKRHSRYGGSLEATVEVWTRVLSRPEPGLALLDAGRRDLPFDSGLPSPYRTRRSDRMESVGQGWSVRHMDDQHAYLLIPNDTVLSPGDLVSLGISHPCTFFDKWTWIPVTESDGTVIDAIRTFF